jgi:hypothetical protein
MNPAYGFFRTGCLAVLGCLFAVVPTRGQQTAPKPTGQISGRIYRADTGAPLANARVAAQNTASRTHLVTQTGSDGRYNFKDVPAGSYVVGSYREGFIGGFHTLPPNSNSDFPGVDVPAAASISGIDVRLEPAPRISAISVAAIRAAYPGEGIQFPMGRFSPDGSKLALVISDVNTGGPEQVWMYDMQTRRMVAVTENPLGGRDPGIRALAWDIDGTLYVHGSRGGNVLGPYNVAATMTKSEEIAEFAPRAA